VGFFHSGGFLAGTGNTSTRDARSVFFLQRKWKGFVMNFLVLPPEINSARMFLGAGPGPMLAAAAAWDGLADEFGSASSSFGAVTSGLVDAAWQGPASMAMAAAAAPYTGWLSAAAAQAQGAAGQARAGASAFEAAMSAVVHPGVV
jgi:PPE-repeat protein